MDVSNITVQHFMRSSQCCATEEDVILDLLPPDEYTFDSTTLAGDAIIRGGISEERARQAETLCMAGSDFDDFVAEYVATEVLPQACNLRVVDVAATRFSSCGLVALLRALQQGPSDVLEELSFCDIYFHADECAVIKQLMARHRSRLKKLQLRRCHIDDTAAQAVAEGVAQAECLSCLGLTNSDVVPAFAIPLAAPEFLFFPASLKVLDISGSYIDPAHNQGLSHAMRRCAATLEELYMARCCVTQATLEFLLRVGLHSSKALRVLNVSSGRLLSSAGQTLCSFLTECSNLERLYVQNNFIGADGAAVMAIGMAAAKKLTVLGMGGCHLGGEGAKVIAEALQQNSALRELDLSDNDVRDEDVQFICELKDGGGLRLNFLDLSYNPLTENSCSSLHALMARQRDPHCVVLVRGTAIGDGLTYMLRKE